MKSFLVGCVVAIVMAVGAAAVLGGMNVPSSEAYTTTGARI
jgi:hypothetical protein